MKLIKKLKDDMLTARKESDKHVALLLSSVIGEVDRSKEKLDDIQIEKLIRGMCNNLIIEIGTTESIAEAKILEKYLSELMSEEKIEKEVDTIIADLNVEGMKNIGRVMGEFTKLFKGKADMKIVSDVVRKKLN